MYRLEDLFFQANWIAWLVGVNFICFAILSELTTIKNVY